MKKIIAQKMKKLCFLCLYSFLFLYILFYIKSHVFPETVICTPHNPDLLHIENAMSSKVDNEFESYLITYYNDEKLKKKIMWQLVSNDTYIYSAYLDECPQYLQHVANICVKCIGFAKSNIETQPRKCTLKLDSRDIKSGIIFEEKVPESHDEMYAAVNFYCLIKERVQNLLLSNYVLSITSFNKSVDISVENLLLNTISTSLTVSLCVRPLYGKVSSVTFVEFISYYSIMGIDHFIFYHENTTGPFESFLKLLKKSNLSSDILPWDIPVNNELIHSNGQMIFTQDCIARSKYKFTHTAIVDLDEFIVPKVNPNIKSLLKYLDELNPNAGSYIIPMSFFCDEYALEKYPVIPLKILNHKKRQKSFWQHKFRSKYILKPDKVLLSGIHFIWKYDGEWSSVLVPSSVALLHHYRSCCGVQQTYFFHLFKFYVLTDEVVFDDSLIDHKMDLLNHSLIKFVLKPYYKFAV